MVDQRNQNSSAGSQDRGTPGGEGPKLGQGGASMSQASNPAAGQAADRNRGASAGSGQSVSGSKENESGMAATMRDTVGTVKEKASEALEGASGWAEDTYDRVSDWASEAGRTERFGDMRRQSSQSMRRMSGGLQEYVAENPMVVGIVGLAAGMLIGALLPRTRRENEAFGEWADELRHQGVRYAREATQKGREFVEESFEGEDPRFGKHESEFKSRDNLNRH